MRTFRTSRSRSLIWERSIRADSVAHSRYVHSPSKAVRYGRCRFIAVVGAAEDLPDVLPFCAGSRSDKHVPILSARPPGVPWVSIRGDIGLRPAPGPSGSKSLLP
jgi:hypothetical protein